MDDESLIGKLREVRAAAATATAATATTTTTTVAARIDKRVTERHCRLTARAPAVDRAEQHDLPRADDAAAPAQRAGGAEGVPARTRARHLGLCAAAVPPARRGPCNTYATHPRSSLLPRAIAHSLALTTATATHRRHSPPLALATPATSFSLFRETTAPSLLLSSYAHLVGNEFFRQLLRPALEPVLHGAYSLDSQDVRRSRLLHQSATDTHAIPLLCAELNQYGVGDADATAALAIGGLALMRAGRGGRV